MDKLDIPEEQIVPIEDVAPGVRGLRIAFVNVFSIEHSDGSWTLLDAALPLSQSLIRSWSEKHFNRPPNAIILTHGHFDHVGAAGTLAEDWNVPIYAHPLEFPYLTGEEEYPRPNVGAGGGLMSLLSPLYPRKPVNLGARLRSLTGEDIPMMPGWKILHTPGHTPGHVSFFREEDRTLLVGDAFCTTKPESFFDAAVTQPAELHGPPSYFTSDWNAARRSVQKLAALEPVVIAPGHGKPIAGSNIADALHQLAADFDRIAVPDNQQRKSA